MDKRILFLSFLAITLSLSIIKAFADYLFEKKMNSDSTHVDKKSEYSIFIEIEDKILYLLQDGSCIKRYHIASGTPDNPSPIGTWKIINKGDWGKGFGGRWMGLNVPWGKYGIHGTTRPSSIGSAASHGCIRMHNKDVRELYSIVPHGTTVVIANGIFGPFGNGFKSLGPGDRGADVMAIQIRLKGLGYYKGWVSGIYGEELKIALHKFQKDKGLTVTNTITKRAWEEMGFVEFE